MVVGRTEQKSVMSFLSYSELTGHICILYSLVNLYSCPKSICSQFALLGIVSIHKKEKCRTVSLFKTTKY